jgi:hypothetical protein
MALNQAMNLRRPAPQYGTMSPDQRAAPTPNPTINHRLRFGGGTSPGAMPGVPGYSPAPGPMYDPTDPLAEVQQYLPTEDPSAGFSLPDSADPAYNAWRSQAELRRANEMSTAKMRRQQADEAYRQAVGDFAKQSDYGRRNLQTSLLSRGIFVSGEADRRKQEMDAGVEQGKVRLRSGLVDAYNRINDTVRTDLGSIGMEGQQQMSQAALRASLAQYQQQQQAATLAAAQQNQSAAYQAAAAPAPQYAPQQPVEPQHTQADWDRLIAAYKPKPSLQDTFTTPPPGGWPRSSASPAPKPKLPVRPTKGRF